MTLPIANPAVICKAVSDGAVLFSPSEEAYFGLNEVGARIWHLLPPETSSFDELCARLRAEYPTEEDATIRADARSLLDDLMQQGLVLSPATGERSGEPDPPQAP